jgi:hypothetical protein
VRSVLFGRPWEIVDWLAEIQLHPADGAALSFGTQPQIEDSLKQLALEVNRLVSGYNDRFSSIFLSQERETMSKGDGSYGLPLEEVTQREDLHQLSP